MHDDRRDGALRPLVAARAFAGLERLECSGIFGLWRRRALAFIGKGVAIHAVRTRARAKALLRQARGMLDSGSTFMTSSAAARRHRSHAGCTQLMARFAGDSLLLDVYEVAGDAPVTAPLRLDVDASPR
jgi:hypothetical protein